MRVIHVLHSHKKRFCIVSDHECSSIRLIRSHILQVTQIFRVTLELDWIQQVKVWFCSDSILWRKQMIFYTLFQRMHILYIEKIWFFQVHKSIDTGVISRVPQLVKNFKRNTHTHTHTHTQTIFTTSESHKLSNSLI